MAIITQTISDRETWNALIRPLPANHILQTWEWGDFKQATVGWQPERLAFYDKNMLIGAVSLLTRSVGPLKVIYAPKGPLFADQGNTEAVNAVLDHLQALAKKRRAVWLKIDPDIVIGVGEEETPHPAGMAFQAELLRRGWRFSDDQVQFRNTITLDLAPSADDLLAAMSQNTRRKVRTAEKKGVTIRAGTPDDLETLYALYQTTGERDGFLTRPAAYYEKAWRDFMQADLAHALVAEADGVPLAHVILFHFGQTCWYFYGASANEGRDKMPNYALQWAAIQWAKAQGYTVYDFWGAPNIFDESDSMWGVYEFKRGFRGTVTRHLGAYDFAPNALLYRAYAELWPRLRRALRGG